MDVKASQLEGARDRTPKKRRIRPDTLVFLISLGLIPATVVLSLVLNSVGLAFRGGTLHSVAVIVSFGFIVFLGAWIVSLYRGKDETVLTRIIGTFCLLVTIVTILAVNGLLSVFFFGTSQERVVLKDGRKMVAEVVSWTQTNIYYYDHKNRFIRGQDVRIVERYGSGTCMLPATDEQPSTHVCINPLSVSYYDGNGTLIKEEKRP